VVSLQSKGKKVQYSVIWAGDPGTDKAGQLGLQTLKLHNDLWRADLPRIEGTHEIRERLGDRRKQCRYEVCIPVEMRSAVKPPIWAETGDISLSGCYVRPAAGGSLVDLVFWLRDTKVVAKGRVRASIQGVGRGVEFQNLSSEDQQRLTTFCQGGPATKGPARRSRASKTKLSSRQAL
jgi:hypothetical protein